MAHVAGESPSSRAAAAAPLALPGLAEAEAQRRRAERGPAKPPAASRSYLSIVRANVLTVFNLILAVFGAVTLIFGDWRDALFLGILVANAAIGITQEVRAKRALDKLSALVAPTATVVRDGIARSAPVGETSAERIAGEARTLRHPRSPLELAINRLLYAMVALVVLLGGVLGYALWHRDASVHEAVATSAAGVVLLLMALGGAAIAVLALYLTGFVPGRKPEPEP